MSSSASVASADNAAQPLLSERTASVGQDIEPAYRVAPAAQNVMDLDFNEVFDYASFMWNEQGIGDSTAANIQLKIDNGSNSFAPLMAWPSPSTLPLSESELLDLFTRSNAPPILMTAESSLRWSTVRKLLSSMTSSSAMVRHAVLAFSALRQEENGRHGTQYRPYYNKSRNTLLEALAVRSRNIGDQTTWNTTNALAVWFILTYVDVGNSVVHTSTFADAPVTAGD